MIIGLLLWITDLQNPNGVTEKNMVSGDNSVKIYNLIVDVLNLNFSKTVSMLSDIAILAIR